MKGRETEMERDRETKKMRKRGQRERGRGRREEGGDLPGGPAIKIPGFTAGGTDFNPSQGTKILHAML